jgi:hypothetical protein
MKATTPTEVPTLPPLEAQGSRLFLLINRTIYRVRPLRGDPATAARAFRLNKPDGTLYDVAQTVFGPTCDCPDFIFRRDGLDPAGCKHVKALVAEGLIESSVGAKGREGALTGPGRLSRILASRPARPPL